jgi:hypothetical protein
MSDAKGRSAEFVPTSFEDLRRDTGSRRAQIPTVEEKTTSRDLHDLVAQGRFMKNSALVAAGAFAIGLVLILIAYVGPMLGTVDAVHTAGQVAVDKVREKLGGLGGSVSGLASKAAAVQATDEKAINTAKGGMACLTGKAACPNGSSPFK